MNLEQLLREPGTGFAWRALEWLEGELERRAPDWLTYTDKDGNLTSWAKIER